MIITLVGKGARTLLTDLDAAGIAHESHNPQPGAIMNAGDSVSVLQIAIPVVATVIVAWLKYAPTRKAMITKTDGTVLQAEGRSVKEVQELLLTAKAVMILDAKNPDPNTK